MFLAFQVGTVRYCYTACPFGLSPLPQVFTEICMPLKVYAREQWGCSVFQYIDDWLLFSCDRHAVSTVTREFVRLCVRLGVGVNLEKSVLYASRTLVHLGVQWDFETACVRPTDDKIAKVCELLTRVPNAQHSPSIVGVVVGYASFLREARTLGPSAFSVLQRTMLRELRQGRLFRWVTLSRFARHDLTWWRTALSSVRWVRVREPKPTLIVYTDASKLSLGYSYNVTNSGVWSVAEAAMHINVLETRVVRLTLEHAPQAFAGQSVCFCLDNVSAVYYLNKQGGTRLSTLMTEARTVLILAERLDVHVTAVHVRGELNVLADMLSRRESVIKAEWRLFDAAFQWLCANSPWGLPCASCVRTR